MFKWRSCRDGGPDEDGGSTGGNQLELLNNPGGSLRFLHSVGFQTNLGPQPSRNPLEIQ